MNTDRLEYLKAKCQATYLRGPEIKEINALHKEYMLELIKIRGEAFDPDQTFVGRLERRLNKH